MSKYENTHEELRALIVAQLKSAALRRNEPDSDSLDELLKIKAGQLLHEYEQLASRRAQPSFWYGVWQSLVGGLLVFPILAFVALALTGFKINVFQVLWEGPPATPAIVKPTPGNTTVTPLNR